MPKKPKCEKDARHYHKYLWELTESVRGFLALLDAEMKKPSTVERGKTVARLCNELDMANDSARYFGLGIDYRKDKKPAPKTSDRIVKKPGVCGGCAIVAGSRIPVWGLVEAREAGASDCQILNMYPRLTLADLSAAWRYVEANEDEIRQDIAENREEEEVAR